MGYALTQALLDAGARVTLVSGPVSLLPPDLATTIHVTSADEMLGACQSVQCDIFVGVAAVADFKPVASANHKIKKQPGQDEMEIRLVKNPDILGTIAGAEKAPFCVGFAAETDDIADNAKAKLASKKLGLVFANHATDTFNRDEAAVTAYWPEGEQAFEPASKSQLTARMTTLISHLYHLTRS
jgi:phosphopantothenoylcysteine decarboxylase/phosphopantothenate--cysteine ligase